MNEKEKTRINEIIDLHERFADHLTRCLEYGLKIGELLRVQKVELNHGEWFSYTEEIQTFISGMTKGK